jgi:glutaredoxin
MSFFEPLNEGYTVYTKSGCTYCEKAKELFNKREEKNVVFINCDEYVSTETIKPFFLSFIARLAKREWKTFPMVFCKGEFIGGYTDLLRETLDFSHEDF